MNSDFGVFDTFFIDEEAEVWGLKAVQGQRGTWWEGTTSWELHKKDSTGWRLVCIIPPEALADMRPGAEEDQHGNT